MVSIDLEMSWGAVHHGRPHRTTPYESEREIVEGVLDLMETHGISATWAVVGHLFLSSCTPVEGRKHPEIRRPRYGWHEADWYDLDPASSLSVDPTWYGPDLIEKIRRCQVDQEIGSHSFGHIIAGDPECDEAAFESDLEACIQAATSAGLSLRSYVFPRNSIGHLNVLERKGFVAYRGAPTFGRARPGSVSGIVESGARALIPSRHHPEHPYEEDGLVNVPQTYLFDPGSTTARRLGTRLWSALVRRRLRGAIETGSLFHVWFHTHNLAENPKRALAAFDALLADVRVALDTGLAENLTMSQVADRLSRE